MKAGVLLFAVLVFQCCVYHALSQRMHGRKSHSRGGFRGHRFHRLGGNMANSPFSPRGRGRNGDIFHGLQRRLEQRLGKGGNGNQSIDLSPVEVSVAFWNRTLEGGVRVLEKGVFQNTSLISVMRVASRDRALTSAGYVGAATLYVFGEQSTMVILKPGYNARRMVPACFLLPDRNITYSEAVDEVVRRNHTDVTGAPATQEMLNGTAQPLDMMERIQMYGQHPAILVFCGFSGLVKVVPADDQANFPTVSNGTETEQVLRMITLDRELQILVPRPPAKGGPARRPGRHFFPRHMRGNRPV